MFCPLCASRMPFDSAVCPGCGADLTDFISASYQADMLFNEALKHIEYQRYSDAADILCRACEMRPDDLEMLELRIRCEYLSGNSKKALELMTCLLEKDGSDRYAEQLNILAEEYDLAHSSAEEAVKIQLSKQCERMSRLIDKMESRVEEYSGKASPELAVLAEKPQKGSSDTIPDFTQFSAMFPAEGDK